MDSRKKYRLMFFPLSIFLIIVLAVLGEKSDREENDNYFSATHLQLTGVVTYIERPGWYSRAVVGLNVLNSNVKEYIPLSKPPYYCVIKGNKAELFEGVDCGIGDTMMPDTDKGLLTVKGHGKNFNWPTTVYLDKRFYKWYTRRKAKL